MTALATKMLWPRAASLALALHLSAAGAFSAHQLFASVSEDYGAENAMEFAPLVASAESEFTPEAAERDAEDRMATPKLDETLSQKRETELPTEQASPAEAEQDLRMAEERTRKESDKPTEQQQATEAMQQQTAQVSSQASVAGESAPDQSGAKNEVARAPEEGNTLEAQRRLEAWQKKLFAHIVRFKRYPAQARGKRLAGEARVSFSLDAKGEVLALKLAKTSGHDLLDTAALDWMMRASPLPAPPPGAVGREFALPMKFSVQ